MNRLFACLAILFTFLSCVSLIHAQTIHVVTSLDDSGSGTLRQAVADAADGDTIVFGVHGTLTLTSSLTLDKNITIRGPGARLLTITSNSSATSFPVSGSATVTIERLTIANSLVGGGNFTLISVVALATLNLNDVVITDNNCYNLIHVAASSTVNIFRSEISENVIESGTGVLNTGGTITVSNSTIAENSSSFGTVIRSYFSSASVTVNQSTIVRNESPDSYDGALRAHASGSSITLKNSIVANNADSSNPDLSSSGSGSYISEGYNFISNTGAATITATLGDTFGTSASPLIISTPAIDYVGNSQTRVSPISDARVETQIPGGTNDSIQPNQVFRYSTSDTDIGAYVTSSMLPNDPEVYVVPEIILNSAVGANYTFKGVASWVENLAQLQVELATDPGFITLQRVGTLFGPFAIGDSYDYNSLSLNYNTTYYARARGTNDNGDTFQTVTYAFTTPHISVLKVDVSDTEITDGSATLDAAINTDFGTIRVGDTKDLSYDLSNSGSKTATISSSTLPTGYSFTTAPSDVASGADNQSFTVRFAPATPGTFSGDVEINSDDYTSPLYNYAITGHAGASSIAVTGNGNTIANGSNTTSATNHTDFGSFLPTDAPTSRTFTITNAGDLASTLAVSVSNDSPGNPFSVVNLSDSSVVASGSETVQIQYDPSLSSGADKATVTVTSQDWQDATYTYVISAALSNSDLSGTITLQGEPLSGITVKLDGDSTASTTTAADGSYTFSVINGFSGTITPVSGSYQFSPGSIAVSNVTADSPGNDFTASTTYNLSGYIFFRGEPLADVKVSTGGMPAMTDSDGFYVIEVDTDFSGNLTASRDGFRFLPSQIPVGPVRSNLLNLDFRGRLIDQSAAWPTIRYFHTGNAPVDDLGSVELHWSVDNVDSVDISGVGGGLPPAGMTEVKVKGTQTFELTAENDLGSVSSTISAGKPKRPEILWFTSSHGKDTPLSAGDTAVIDYGVQHGDELTLGPQAAATSADSSVELEGGYGSVEVSPAETTRYKLTARNGKRTSRQRLTISVVDAPVIREFAASEETIAAGDDVTLSWQVEGAEELTINGTDQQLDPEKGSFELSPIKTTTYVLAATAANGEQSRASAEVAVVDPKQASDLLVTLERLDGGGRLWAGTQVPLAVTVYNDGPVGTGPVRVIILIDDEEHLELTFDTVPAGSERRKEAVAVLNAVGRCVVRAVVSSELPNELNTANNTDQLLIPTKKRRGVDLILSPLSLEKTQEDDVFIFSFSVTNVGKNKSGTFQVSVYSSDRQDNLRGEASVIWRNSIEGLKRGERRQITGLVKQEGKTLYLLAVADDYDATGDVNAENNSASIER